MKNYKIEKIPKKFKIREIKQYLEKKFNKNLFLELISFDIYEDYEQECFCGTSKTYMIIEEENVKIVGDPYMVAYDSQHAIISLLGEGEFQYKLDTILKTPYKGIYAILDGPIIDGCTMINPTEICIEDNEDKKALIFYQEEKIPLYKVELSKNEIKTIISNLDSISNKELKDKLISFIK